MHFCVFLMLRLIAAGAFFSFFTGPVTRIGGRKLVMILGGASFCVGAILCAFAQDLAMLIIGRVCLGAGVGFANQVHHTVATSWSSLHGLACFKLCSMCSLVDHCQANTMFHLNQCCQVSHSFQSFQCHEHVSQNEQLLHMHISLL